MKVWRVDTHEGVTETEVPALERGAVDADGERVGRHPCYGGMSHHATSEEARRTLLQWAWREVEICQDQLEGHLKEAEDVRRLLVVRMGIFRKLQSGSKEER